MAIIGNTVRIYAEFKTWAGVLSDVASTQIKITDNTGQIYVTATEPAIKKQSTGIYYYDFTVPDGNGKISYEWKAVLELSDIVNRGYLEREYSA